MRAFRIAAVAVVMVAAALWLLRDSMTYTMAGPDPVTGRGRGCYTDLEAILGVKKPDTLRGLETVAGLAGLLYAPIYIFWRPDRQPPAN